jgi:hypothetical protein
MTIPAATLAATIALGALLAPPAARAGEWGEYCQVNDSHLLLCYFSSMEQCHATANDCTRDPFFKTKSIANINRNAYAYSPRPVHRARTGRAAKSSD